MLDWLRSLFRSHVRLYVYLPVEYNPDPEHPEAPRRRVPGALRRATIRDIQAYLGARFEGLSSEVVVKERVRGEWQGIRDKLRVVYLDLELSRKDRQWFKNMQTGVWKDRFEQDKIYVVYHTIKEP